MTPTPPMIIHLSDLHIGSEDCEQRFEHIVAAILERLADPSAYIVVITGDLVENARIPENYERARLHLDRLAAAGFRLLMVPGNHDYGNGALGSKRFVELFKTSFLGTAAVEYPKLDLLDGIAFVGLDSMIDELNWYDCVWAQGQLGRRQLERLDALLAEPAVRAAQHRVVYLHHHPFDYTFAHQLKDAKRLGKVLGRHGNIDALLYGHNHTFGARNGLWGIPRCYDAGSSTGRRSEPGPVRLIRLDTAPDEDRAEDFRGGGPNQRPFTVVRASPSPV